MRICGRSCMSFYTRKTKIRCVRCVRYGPVDAYLYTLQINYKNAELPIINKSELDNIDTRELTVDGQGAIKIYE
uniref:SFRICE_022606 n=1 Tax=Spodoptera frugiperda TaxID=7108 RepID=A0A2H1VNH8_SPOFR